MNLIVVTAGNYKTKTEDDGGGVVDHQARLATSPQPLILTYRLRASTPKTIPWKKHDHPTSRQRLGDVEAGLGSAATLTPADADAIRQICAACSSCPKGIHENVHAPPATSAGSPGSTAAIRSLRVDPPVVDVHGRTIFSPRASSLAAPPVVVLSCLRRARSCSASANPVGQQILLWKQPFQVVGVIGSGSWMVAPSAGDDQFDAVYVPFTTIHQAAEPVEAERHQHHGRLHRRSVAGLEAT